MDHVDDYLFDGVHVLLGEDGSVIKEDGTPFTQYVWGRFWVNNHAHVLQGKGISNELLLCFLKQANITPFVSGAVQLKLNQKNLKRIPFLFSGPDTSAAFDDIVTQNRTLPANAIRDLLVALIALKYTQSNSVCYAYDGQVIGMGAGQQSRIHCTRLAGSKADTWYLRQHPRVLSLPFRDKLPRPERDNAIDQFLLEELTPAEEANWQQNFSRLPVRLTRAEKRAWLDQLTGVSLGSDAFFPFRDSIDRAYQSGVSYVAQPGGSIRDDIVIEACDEYNMVMAQTNTRLFHH